MEILFRMIKNEEKSNCGTYFYIKKRKGSEWLIKLMLYAMVGGIILIRPIY